MRLKKTMNTTYIKPKKVWKDIKRAVITVLFGGSVGAIASGTIMFGFLEAKGLHTLFTTKFTLGLIVIGLVALGVGYILNMTQEEREQAWKR